jgi:hypothetical protein
MSSAKSFSTCPGAPWQSMTFAVLTIPLWAIGLYAISRTGMKLKDIRQEIGTLTKRTPV